jgi:S-adenosyl methyltransferase
MERPDWAPAEVDTQRPSAARVWDYFLGGAHNFAVDRQVADEAIKFKPDMPDLARAVRGFLRSSVRLMVNSGIDQLIDIGSGIPTVGNVHEVAQKLNPNVRVVYVDHDPVAHAHSLTILAGDDRIVPVQGDLRDPDSILAAPALRETIDFARPVGLLLVGVLHFVFDEYDPVGILRRLRDAVVPGSYLAIQHATYDSQPEATRQMLQYWNSQSPESMRWRTKEQIAAFFGDWSLIEPGIVFLPLWPTDTNEHGDEQVDEHPERFASYAAVARKDPPGKRTSPPSPVLPHSPPRSSR